MHRKPSKRFLQPFKCFQIQIEELIMIRIRLKIHLVQIELNNMRVDTEPVMTCLLQRIFLSLCFRALQIHNTNIDNNSSNLDTDSNTNNASNSIKTKKEIL